ncbi:MAG TPA: hypothetical protein VK148_11090 [Xanthobacteraceae bacterium]|jgi:hypothetical protein|nr:hypothetical protein [Xanthobacteraceae bacterium]
MLERATRVAAVAFGAALVMTIGDLVVGDLVVGSIAVAADLKYPSWKGQWTPVTAPASGHSAAFDPAKPEGRAQHAPLTPEYQKALDDSVADIANGGFGHDPTALCYAAGMPRMMTYEAQEYVITPEVTYIMLGGDDHLRRVNTDGRDWPKNINPTYQGYSIGRWIDEDGDGTYDVLEVETRGPFKGPRAYDTSGLPLHLDDDSTFKERFFIDKADPNLLHDVITVFDKALTRPWTADKTFRRNADPQPEWPEYYCHVTSNRIVIGGEAYRMDADGVLMPTRKDQPPPDLKFFTPMQR